MKRRKGGKHNVVIASQTSANKSLWRVFCAIELPEAVRTKLSEHILHLRNRVPEAKATWSRPENVHLTLKFFGNVDQAIIPNLSATLDRVSENILPFKVVVEGTGKFPPRGLPKVLWNGISDPTQLLSKLHRLIEDECDREGFAKDDRPFRPHLTLARLRDAHGARELAATHLQTDFSAEEIFVNEIVLFRSEPGSEIARYSVISRHELEAR